MSKGRADKPTSQKAFQGASGKCTTGRSLFLRLPCLETQSRVYFQVGQTQEHRLILTTSQETAMVTRRWCVHAFREYPLQRPEWGRGCVLSKLLGIKVPWAQIHHQKIGGYAWTRSSEQMPVFKDTVPRPQSGPLPPKWGKGLLRARNGHAPLGPV